MISIATCVAVFVAAWLIKAIYHTTYWRRLNVPGPPSLPVLGCLWTTGWNTVCYSKIISEWSRKYGGCYGFQKGAVNFLVLSDPKLVKEVMVEKFNVFHSKREAPSHGEPDQIATVSVFSAGGKRWKRIRSILNPAFSTKNLKRLMPTIYDAADRMVEHMDKRRVNGKSLDVTPFFFEMTLDMMLRVAFGQDGSRQWQNPLADELRYQFKNVNSLIMMLSWMFPSFWRPLYEIEQRMNMISKRGVGAGIYKMGELIKERKKLKDAGEKSEGHEDFIDILLENETTESQYEKTVVYNNVDAKVVKKMDITEIQYSCLIFLLAGPETTAVTMTFVTYYLAKYPEMQEKLRKEIEDVCVDPEPSYEQLAELKYAEIFVREALRLEPNASGAISRRCTQDTYLSNGVFVKAGTAIEIDAPTLHRNTEVWGEDANEFRPERYLEPSAIEQSYSFGGGPRICIGMRLALLTEKILLVKLLRKYRFKMAADTDSFAYTGAFTYTVDRMNVLLEEL
ncbi:unnamed protein product [Bursaphelenchus xylophilus]|uniref:(pine wood nematode) hypothetical protein n=1 Tax=Bursaphelenchus xylophilus TaxID=6326 RepID=A0A1I7RN13_BURXY|nr:unnamed protein product [Bursaphelenchus xylophilus]CAG9125278.1 unnamed protein product [Bursaphelenchus xylophilus]